MESRQHWLEQRLDESALEQFITSLRHEVTEGCGNDAFIAFDAMNRIALHLRSATVTSDVIRYWRGGWAYSMVALKLKDIGC